MQEKLKFTNVDHLTSLTTYLQQESDKIVFLEKKSSQSQITKQILTLNFNPRRRLRGKETESEAYLQTNRKYTSNYLSRDHLLEGVGRTNDTEEPCGDYKPDGEMKHFPSSHG
jgi:hypothetical protein